MFKGITLGGIVQGELNAGVGIFVEGVTQ